MFVKTGTYLRKFSGTDFGSAKVFCYEGQIVKKSKVFFDISCDLSKVLLVIAIFSFLQTLLLIN